MILFNLYQINTNKDVDHICFRSLNEAYRGFNGRRKKLVSKSIYDKVYGGEVEKATSLRDIYVMFNIDKPKEYKGRSMSVSDIIEVINSNEIVPGYYYCDVMGFKEVEFS